MRNTLNPCRRWLLAVAVLILCLGEAQAGLVGESLAEMGLDEQVQNAGDALYNSATSAAIGGERGAAAGRGITGALGDLALNSGKITCSLWIIQLRSHFRNLISSAERARATGADDAEIARLDDLIAKTQDFALKLEAACNRVGWLTDPPSEEWKTLNRLKNAVGLGPAAAAPPETPAPPRPPAPEPWPEGWNAADVHCRNMCSGIFEAYANALAGSRNKHAEADALRRGELADAIRKETQAQRNLDESRQIRNNRPSNIRRDERQLEEAQTGTREVQGRIERIAAEGDALAARAQELLERLKECVKGCRKQIKDMAGVDATRIDTYFTNRVREGGSAQDAQRYTTLSGATEERKSRIADKSAKADRVKEGPKQAIKDGAPAKGAVARSGVAVAKDGDPPVKVGDPPKLPREKMGGGMTQIDPEPPRESILDSLDDANFRRAPAPTTPAAAACPDCASHARRLAEQQAELKRESEVLDRMRKDYADITINQDRRVPEAPAAIQAKMELVAQAEANIRRQAQKVESLERGIDIVRRQLEACNKTSCAQPPPGQDGTAVVVPDRMGAHVTRCSVCNHMGGRLGEIERERAAKQTERDRLLQEAQAILRRGLEGKQQPGDDAQVQQRDRRADALDKEINALNGQAERLEREMQECERTACPLPKAEDGRKDAAVRKGDPVGPAGGGAGGSGGGGCYFQPVKPVIIGPREQFGYGDEQKAGEVGKAALSILGGFLGGRGGGGRSSGPVSPPGGDKPRLADDPIRDKQTFADPQTGTAIQVGAQYRPDGKLLVSVGVDKAEDKGVVHQATMERLQYLPSGGCATQVAEPVEWLHYEIWEDWWAKIRIQRYESVDGGPWRKTHDTGWRDWGSGTRLLESGTMSADQIPRTAWGSMGADRAFGGPRAAGALFDPGKPAVTGQPAAERLVVHVSQPGKDPVTTVPFTLYPTYGADGKVKYTDQAPDWEAMRRMRTQRVPDKMGGGMQQIDPPATGAAPRESILDSIDSGVGKTPLAK